MLLHLVSVVALLPVILAAPLATRQGLNLLGSTFDHLADSSRNSNSAGGGDHYLADPSAGVGSNGVIDAASNIIGSLFSE